MSSGDTRNRIVFATTSMSEMEAWVVGIQTCIYNSTRQNGAFKENGTVYSNLTRQGKTVLSWKQRLNIGLGVARGLSHLHAIRPNPIIHLDIKSENVLLDKNYEPFIADFGLYEKKRSRVITFLQKIGTLFNK